MILAVEYVPYYQKRGSVFTVLRVLLFGLVLASLVPVADAQRQEYQLDGMEVRLELTEDGRYLVEEDITFGFQQGTFTQGFRVIPGRRIEEIRDVEVVGRNVTVTEMEHERDDGDHVITWTFPERSAPATFTLRYEVLGALVADDEHNMIDWDAVGDAIEVPVENVRVSVSLPDFGLDRNDITIQPADDGVLDRVESGWHASFEHPGLAAETPYRVVVTFPRQLDGRRPEPPDIYFLYGLLGFLGGLIPGILAWFSRRGPKNPTAEVLAVRPNLPLTQAAGLVLDGLSFSSRAYPAMLFDLARRGHLTLRQSTGDDEALEVTLHPKDNELSLFEKVFVQELSKYDSFQKYTEASWTWQYESRKIVRTENVADGLIADRRNASNRLLTLAAVTVLAGVALIFTLSGWGVPVAIGGTIGVALGLLVAAERRWVITDAGIAERMRAKNFIDDLRVSIDAALDRGDIASAAMQLAEDLPWLFLDPAIDEDWLKRFSKAVEEAGDEIVLPKWIAQVFGGGELDGGTLILLISSLAMIHPGTMPSGAFGAGAGVSGSIGGGSVGAS